MSRTMTDATKPRPNPLASAPNLLTLLRICLAPFLVAAILENQFKVGFILFVAAGLTDALDGLLARVLKQRTVLGQYLDPVADKLLLSTLFLVLMHEGLMPVRVTVLVFGRDVGILVVSAILYAAVGRREFHPSIFGKANTLAQVQPSRLSFCISSPSALGGRSPVLRTVGHDVADRGFGPALCLDRRLNRQQTQPAEQVSSRLRLQRPRAATHRPRHKTFRSRSIDVKALRLYSSSARSFFVSAVSSISMSRNSSESKTSPHSRHSTNSVSSCRETIRTLGCLQAVAIARGFS